MNGRLLLLRLSAGLVAVVTVAACTTTTSSTTSSTSTASTSPSSSSSSSTSTSTPSRDDGCDTVLPSTSLPGEGHATMMTIAPTTGPLTYRVEADPPAACPGARVTLTVHAHNESDETQNAGVSLVIGSIPHIVLGEVGPFPVPASGDASARLVVTVPLLAPGTYTFGLVGGSSVDGSVASGTFTVERPSVGQNIDVPVSQSCMSEVWAVSADGSIAIGAGFDPGEQSTTGPTVLSLSPARLTVVRGVALAQQLCSGAGTLPPSGIAVISGSGTLTLDPPGPFPMHGVLTTGELVLSDGSVISPIHAEASCLGCFPS